MNYVYAFEKLQTWKDARVMVKLIYQLTGKLPEYEKYGLASQMRRAAISVVSNIAEGSGRPSKKDQAHFYSIAYSSCIELLNQAIISNDLEFITECEIGQMRNEIEKVTFKINALRKSCLNAVADQG